MEDGSDARSSAQARPVQPHTAKGWCHLDLTRPEEEVFSWMASHAWGSPGMKKRARKLVEVVATQKLGIADHAPEGGTAVATPVPLEETLCGGMAFPVQLVSLQGTSVAWAVFTTADKASFRLPSTAASGFCEPDAAR